ncbi:MAG: sulfatase, partial [bacterium]|nr:sulfatase [bacterium]
MSEINRRNFVKSGAGVAASFSIGCGGADKPPNIFIVIGDDLTYLDIGCYGNSEVRTPNIDRLAAQGVRFTRAFTGTAMCAPMRQQLYTGMFPVRNGAYPNHSRIKPGVKTLPTYFGELGYRVGLAGKRHFGPPESYPFEQVGEVNKLDFDAIDEFLNRDAGQPSCLVFCSHEPHLPWKAGDPSRYDADRLTVPSYLVDTPETRQAMTRYYAEIESLDGEVGRCLDSVRAAGQEEKTLFAFCSEQGAQFPGAKWTCWELGLHEGVIMRWPGRIRAGSETVAMIQGVDWVPTLLEAAGAPVPDGLDGRSFLRVLDGETDEHAGEVFGVHTTRGIIEGSDCYPVRSVRDERYKLIWNPNAASEFRNVLITDDRENYWQSWVEKAKTDETAARLV